MPFVFTCPHCFHKTLVADELTGRSGHCVQCGKSITVPPPPNPALPVASSQPAGNTASPYRRSATTWGLRVTVFVGVLAILGSVLTWSVAPAIQALKTQRDLTLCQLNLRRIAQALNSYAAVHGSYPPPVVYDETGKVPLYSWRVLILPQLGEHNLYSQFRLDLAWDSTENSLLIPQCPAVFISPAANSVKMRDETSYVLLTGPGTLFPPTGPLSPQNISDGTSNTLLVVEVAQNQILWTQPGDLDFQLLNTFRGGQAPTTPGLNSIGGNHTGGATAVFADEQPTWIPASLDSGVFRALVSPNGNETIDGSWLKK
jgi:hypothetical protein